MDVSECESYIFPAVSGTGLTGSAAYYTGMGGTGTQYNPGDIINTVGTTTVYAFDDNGCTDEESFTVTIVPLPTVDLGTDVSICPSEEVLLDATSAGASYNWSDNSTNSTLTVSAAGSYWVEVTENGCSNSDTVQVMVLVPPMFTLGADTVVCDPPFQISPSSSYVSYLWQDGSVNTSYTVSVPGIYSVTVTDASGCIGNATIVVGNGCQPEISVPNVFTPNGDNTNDIFFATGSNIEDYEMIIVNRWGSVIRTFNSIADEWDGTTENGDEANQGVYFWKITYSYMDGTQLAEDELSGNVTLLRD